MIVDYKNREEIAIEFKDLSVGDVFKIYNYFDIKAFADLGMNVNNYFYLKIQENELNENAVNLSINEIAGFGEQHIVYPVDAKLTVITLKY